MQDSLFVLNGLLKLFWEFTVPTRRNVIAGNLTVAQSIMSSAGTLYVCMYVCMCEPVLWIRYACMYVRTYVRTYVCMYEPVL